jgi:outer membrane protein assembly factor BamB
MILAEIDFESYIPETPALYDGVLYLLTTRSGDVAHEENVTGRGELAAVDAETFEILYRTHTTDAYMTSPYATRELLFLTDDNGKINVHSRKDGKYLITLDAEEKMTPLQAGDDSRVFAVSRNGRLYEWHRENDRWNRMLLTDLQTDCKQGCLLLEDKLIVADENGGLFYYRHHSR